MANSLHPTEYEQIRWTARYEGGRWVEWSTFDGHSAPVDEIPSPQFCLGSQIIVSKHGKKHNVVVTRIYANSADGVCYLTSYRGHGTGVKESEILGVW